MARKRPKFPSLVERMREDTPEIELADIEPAGGMLFLPDEPRHPGGRPRIEWTKCFAARVKRDFEHYFEVGKWGLHWYDNTPVEILRLFLGDVDRATLYITLLAATSPQSSIKQNVRRAWQALRLFDEVGIDQDKFEKQFKFEAHQLNILRALRGQPLSGPKVTAFLKNLLGPAVYPDAADAVTVDLWMMRATHGICGVPKGYNKSDDSPSAAEYRCVQNLVRQLAQVRMVEPRQYQAAVWVGIKTDCGSPDDIADPFEVELANVLDEFNRQGRMDWEDDEPFAPNPGPSERDTARALDMGDGEWVAENPLVLLQQGYSFA